MLYHGGPILRSATVKAIFWGSSWSSSAGDKIAGMDKWYTYIGTVNGGSGSAYEATVNEYTNSSNNHVTTATTYQGHVVDSSSLPKHVSTSAVLSHSSSRYS